jgi:integrase
MRDTRARGYAQFRDGKWWTRIVYYDRAGNRRDERKLFKGELFTDSGKPVALKKAKAIVEAAAQELARARDNTDVRVIEKAGATFAGFAAFYQDEYMKEIEYDADGDKLDPDTMLRPKTLAVAKGRLRVLVDFFGPMKLQEIGASDLKAFKFKRYKTPTPVMRCWKCKGTGQQRKSGRPAANAELPPCESCEGEGKIGGGQRSWVSVNRELTFLNTMLNVAEAEGWIARNKFNEMTAGKGKKKSGSRLIDTKKEKSRQRILSFAEEDRILSAIDSTTKEGARVRLVCILAVDSGMRSGDIKHLDWGDVDFAANAINIRKRTTKTLKARSVPLTQRMREALLDWQRHWYVSAPKKCTLCQAVHDHLVGSYENVGRTWRRVRRAAGIRDVRIHDLRHTFRTRAAHGGLQESLANKITGHSSKDGAIAPMALRYIGITTGTAGAVTEALARARAAELEAEVAGEPIN